MISITTIECQAQERIDKLLNRELDGGTTVYRMAVKRDPDSGEIIKRVKELNSTGNRALAKEFLEAFDAERESADGWEENRNSNGRQITAVWINPKRIYTITAIGSTLSVYAQTVYREERNKEQ
jgi:hypothetical protein